MVESGTASFGDVVPGEDGEIREALRIRVFSAGDWLLKLRADSPALLGEGGAAVPVSRISWRTRAQAYVPFAAGMPAVVAHGSRTGGAGQLVTVDLKIRLESGDELGRYACNLGLLLESL